MFDGNFRGSRREVNLSGSRRRGGSSSSSTTTNGRNSRSDILRSAEAQRKQRQEASRRDKAVRLLQRWTRGMLARIHVVKDLSSQMDTFTVTTDRAQNMAAVSLCLSFMPRFLEKTTIKTTRKILLLKFQRMHGKNPRDWDDGDDEMVDAESSSWFSEQRVVKCTLEELDPDDPTETTTYLLQLLKSIRMATTNMDDDLFLTLVRTIQRWFLRNRPDGSQQQLQQSSSSNYSDDPLLSASEYIMKLAIGASDDSDHSRRRALLATIVLSGPSDLAESHTASGLISLESTFSEKWFEPLVDAIAVLDNHQSSNTQGDIKSNDVILQAISENLHNGLEQRLLSNLLDMTKSPQIAVIIRHILSRPQNFSLRVAVALLVRGETLDSNNDKEKDINDLSNHDQYADTDETEAEEEDEDTSGQQKGQSQPSSSKKARGSTNYYSRKDLLTLGKLDSLYHERIHQAKKENMMSFDENVRIVAKKIVGAPWVDWGVEMLTQSDAVTSGRNMPSQYIEIIGYLMHASSDLRPRMKLNVLSPVAFSKTIMDALWLGVRNDQFADRYQGLTLFADLFSHYLMPLSDLDFVRLHVVRPDEMNQRIAITASDVVSFYRDILYEVYWTKPVLADDVEMTNPRGRLILSGTKLWNILYERWNRLQQVFCDEENWWFPHLSSIGHDRAVVTISERIEDDDNDDAGSDADSDDDDESDDEMAVDGQGIRSRPNNDTSKAEAESDALAGTFRDPKMARVLTSIPQALPFDRRLKLFNSLIRNDKQKALQAASSRRAMMAMAGQMDDDPLTFFDGGARERVTIRRADLYADSMQQLNGLGARLKNQIQVTFVNQHGTEEAGIDGGGVFKEFLDDLIKDAFLPDPKNNADDDDEDNIIKNATPQLFVETPVQTLTVNLSLPSRDARILAHYSFLGRVLGKAVYESILVEPQFALPFLNQCLGKTNSIEDLKNYDEEYYSNLSKLRRFSKEELEISGLTFELTFGGSSGSKPRTVELEPGGRSKAVTQKNAFKYTNLVANELLNKQGAEQTKAFLSGFRDLIPVSWVRLFSCTELQKLISGDDTIRGIDVPGLKKSMSYLGGYHESQPYIQAFWDILENDFTPEQQRKFLRFMTSCSRQPLLGFSSLEPPPSIQQIRLREDDRTKNSRLPTSQTCMNLLKLPNYDDRDLLKEKLIAAVEAGAGFELT